MSINVSPYATNVLDLIDVPLVATGKDVIVKRQSMDFVIFVDGQEYYRTSSNLEASYILNRLDVNYQEG